MTPIEINESIQEYGTSDIDIAINSTIQGEGATLCDGIYRCITISQICTVCPFVIPLVKLKAIEPALNSNNYADTVTLYKVLK